MRPRFLFIYPETLTSAAQAESCHDLTGFEGAFSKCISKVGMKFRLCRSCEILISYLLFSRSRLFEYSPSLWIDRLITDWTPLITVLLHWRAILYKYSLLLLLLLLLLFLDNDRALPLIENNTHNREITLHIALFLHETQNKYLYWTCFLQNSKNRIRRKEMFAWSTPWRKWEERRREEGWNESLLLFLFPGDSKGEDRSDRGHSAVVSGMCFVHVFKYKFKSPVILSQTLFFIQEFLQAITRSKEKEDWNPYTGQSIELIVHLRWLDCSFQEQYVPPKFEDSTSPLTKMQENNHYSC